MKGKIILFLIIWLTYSYQAAAFITDDVEWAPAVEKTLYIGETLTNGPYMVKAVQFPSPVPGYKNLKGEIIPESSVDPMVFLEVYKDGIFLKEVLLSIQGGPEIDPDYEFMISGTGFPPGNSKEWIMEYYKPWAKVGISLRGKPDLDVTISTEKKNYTSGSDHIITAKIEIKNNGNAIAKNVDVIFNADDLELQGGNPGQLHQIYTDIKKSETKNFEIVMLIPDILIDETHNLTAQTECIDIKNLEYASTGSKSITISPGKDFFTVSKSVTKSRIYLNDIINVKLTAANNGVRDMTDIIINDSMNPDFELESNTTLRWEIPLLKPGEWKDIQYSIKPLETSLSGFTLPAANAVFNVSGRHYDIYSDMPLVLVNGPKITLNKTVDKETVNIGDDVTVTVNIINTGNIPTRIEVKDFLPENVSLVGGSTSLDSIFLELNTTAGFSYILRMNTEENIELPAAVANYTGVEYRGITRSSIKSESPVITVIYPKKNTSIPALTPNVQNAKSDAETYDSLTATSDTLLADPEDNQPPLAPGFDVMSGLIVLISMIFFLRFVRR